MLIKEIKQIVSATGAFATYTGDGEQIDKSLSDPVVLWAICVCQEAGETYDAVLGFICASEEGLQSAEDASNFAGYAVEIK